MRAFGFLSSTAEDRGIVEISSREVEREILALGVSNFNESLKIKRKHN